MEPAVISWFINPINYIVISIINHSYWSYVHQLSYRLGAPHCTIKTHHFSSAKGKGWSTLAGAEKNSRQMDLESWLNPVDFLMESHEFPWNSLKFYEISRNLMKFLWIPTKFPWNSSPILWNFMKFPWHFPVPLGPTLSNGRARWSASKDRCALLQWLVKSRHATRMRWSSSKRVPFSREYSVMFVGL